MPWPMEIFDIAIAIWVGNRKSRKVIDQMLHSTMLSTTELH